MLVEYDMEAAVKVMLLASQFEQIGVIHHIYHLISTCTVLSNDVKLNISLMGD